ncbi:CRISPR-associated endonuclease Cas2 [Halomonas sp. THAF5a]|uniref:CRISPR-associated endonuclease Cas2 n=1 Tax=Halomonas sp. THAF5a TaxID=2587844 RepID=UPI0012678A0D|nr:CRISPR-associated endonuclease Cas2 [Halomonas sp. THAF5a]
MSEVQWYVIAYDIREPRRLRKVQRLLRTCGYALQESVFAWQGDHRQLRELQRRLRALIKAEVDDVRGYPVRMGQGILWWGNLPLPSGVIDEAAPRFELQQPVRHDASKGDAL